MSTDNQKFQKGSKTFLFITIEADIYSKKNPEISSELF
jgi:hypothetical protein